jgi:hypothetical protein
LQEHQSSQVDQMYQIASLIIDLNNERGKL